MLRNKPFPGVALGVAIALAIVFAASLLIADTGSTVPKITENPGKIAVGARPSGSIAFIRDGGIWIMNTDGGNRRKVSGVTNAVGRLSFSPDNKRIAFARRGRDASKLPSDEGGMHLLHDIFIAFVDSAATNTGWWKRATFGLGGQYPQWSDNDSVVYFQNDINANFVDYMAPSHQLAKVTVTDGHNDYLRKDWQMLNTSMLMPCLTRDRTKLAYVISYSDEADKYIFRNHGIKIINTSNMMIPESEMRKPTPGLEDAISPSWSPDGQWLAYLGSDMRNPGIFIVNSDLSEIRQVFAPSVSQQLTADPVGWSPDSKWLTFATGDGIVYIMDINGDNLTPLTGTGQHSSPAWSN